MTFKFEDAIRTEVPLMIGLCGGPGAGKTLSALRLAKGIQAVRGGPIAVIDTEGGRAKKYVDIVPFKTIVMRPPFNPARFSEAIKAALVLNPACVIIDSMSDEHEGEGGVLDMHEAELNRMAGGDWQKRDRMTQAAWIRPKAERKALVSSLYQIMTPLIFNFRAREKTKQIQNARGKMEPTNIGWQPIAPSEIVHTMDVMAVLPLKSDGVPMWKSDKVGEGFVIKHPIQFRGVLLEGEPLSERMGTALAEWARGGSPSQPAEGHPSGETRPAARTPAPPTEPPGGDHSEALAEGRMAAGYGRSALEAWWKRMPADTRTALKPVLDSELKPTAEKVDAKFADASETEGA